MEVEENRFGTRRKLGVHKNELFLNVLDVFFHEDVDSNATPETREGDALGGLPP